MTETVLVAVAWPYANSRIHVGNITGSYLPADIFARYQRLKGNQVIMVSGSDAHGTPVAVRADKEDSTPLQVYEKFHAGFIDLFRRRLEVLRKLILFTLVLLVMLVNCYPFYIDFAHNNLNAYDGNSFAPN